CGQGTNVPPTF
nr:immunoglobulin light chain junction region [Macaca mulatta]MOV64371.1 immunoglobulin light chain junction region [Macaca mulatta]MOV64693.1 immunoglobulin light chain junction region [Macaca mulatta]MOW40409.1 immunoglobulin light chain junction region [Macaca mulatta]